MKKSKKFANGGVASLTDLLAGLNAGNSGPTPIKAEPPFERNPDDSGRTLGSLPPYQLDEGIGYPTGDRPSLGGGGGGVSQIESGLNQARSGLDGVRGSFQSIRDTAASSMKKGGSVSAKIDLKNCKISTSKKSSKSSKW